MQPGIKLKLSELLQAAGHKPVVHMCRKDGHAATTDANLVLGRILPEFFPKIFGKTEDQPLDAAAAEAALDDLARQVNEQAESSGRRHMSRDEVRCCVQPQLWGFLQVKGRGSCTTCTFATLQASDPARQVSTSRSSRQGASTRCETRCNAARHPR